VPGGVGFGVAHVAAQHLAADCDLPQIQLASSRPKVYPLAVFERTVRPLTQVRSLVSESVTPASE
jgi:hypothetical protein